MSEYLASVFLSYSHADKPLAQALCDGLAGHGCRVWIDEGELRIGDSLVDAISQALDQVDFVAVLVSEASVGSNWCRKEVSLAMTGEINRRGVTVLPIRIDDTPMPGTLKDKLYLTIDRQNVDAAVETLIRDIRRHLQPGSSLPPRRRPSAGQAKSESIPAEGEIKVTGIDSDGITQPRNDGVRGSALYAVPFTLSRVPDSEWSAMLVQHWNRPSRFTTMHRPGIARISGSRVILDGTTIEEVERYHLETLKLAVAEANKQYAHLLEQRKSEAQRRGQLAQEQQRRVQEALDRLDFS